MNYYIADTHFFHNNIINLDNDNGSRKCSSIEEHDELIISNINKIVKPEDRLYFLGDISLGTPEETVNILKRINCKNLFAIKGNHDEVLKKKRVRELFQGVYNYTYIQDGEKTIILSHYPIMFYQAQHRGSIMLYAHLHNTREEQLFQNACKHITETTDIPMNCYNVGCMLWNYTPVTLEQILVNKEK